MSLKVKCPQCGKETLFSSENKFRPFCSERCKVIDLGEWASGSYKIPDSKPLEEAGLDMDNLDMDNRGDSDKHDLSEKPINKKLS